MTHSSSDYDNEGVPKTIKDLISREDISTGQLNAWVENTRQERARKRADAPVIAQRLKRDLFPELLRMQLAEATIIYDGWADDGDLETIVLTRTDKTQVPNDHPVWEEPCTGCEGVHSSKTVTVREALEDIAWWLLETFYPGFENDEGAAGEIVLDFWGNKISIDHDVRFYAYERHSEEL